MRQLHPLPSDLGTEILRVQTGSRLYGTDSITSDDDQMGIAIPHPPRILGLSNFEQYGYRDVAQDAPSQPDSLDLTVYSLRKFASLAAQGNPSIISILFAPAEHPSHQLIQTPIGQELIQCRAAFLSLKTIHRFLGFLQSQKTLITKLNPDTSTPALSTPSTPSLKPAYHAVRLAFEAQELLTTQTITFPHPPTQRGVLQSVRNGELSLHQVFTLINSLEESITDALETTQKTQKTNLPETPDTQVINDFLIHAHLTTWSQQ